jgi:hypothetical protein
VLDSIESVFPPEVTGDSGEFPPEVTGDSGEFPPEVTGDEETNPPKVPVNSPQRYRGSGMERQVGGDSYLSCSRIFFFRAGQRSFEIRLKIAVFVRDRFPPKLPAMESKTPQRYRMSQDEVFCVTSNHRDTHLDGIQARILQSPRKRIPQRYRGRSGTFPRSYR